MDEILTESTSLEKWLRILLDEISVLDQPEHIAAGEVYTLLAHRDELQLAVERSRPRKEVLAQIEEIDRRLLRGAEIVANAENLARLREVHNRIRGYSVAGWWWHLDEIASGLRYLQQLPKRLGREVLSPLMVECASA